MSDLDLEHVLALYREHAADLRLLRDQQRALYARHGWSRGQRTLPFRGAQLVLERLGRDALARGSMRPRLDDVEAEVLYLLARMARPRTAVEISPGGGWSTTWLLSALRDNGAGSLSSYDVTDRAARLVPRGLGEGRWSFVQGDVRSAALPERIDFLLLDSDHGAAFAAWYLDAVLPRVATGAPVAVHDVFHVADPQTAPKTGEDRVVLDWLDANGVPWLTLSPLSAPDAAARVAALRAELGLGDPIHFDRLDTMVFFRAP
jgi:predicted O-methyltransferase YrrM